MSFLQPLESPAWAFSAGLNGEHQRNEVQFAECLQAMALARVRRGEARGREPVLKTRAGASVMGSLT